MINEIITKQIAGKDYDIRKGGVTDSLEIQGVFSYLVSESKVDLDSKTEDDFNLKIQSAMNETSLPRIKKIIIKHLQGPKLDHESYEELDFTVIFPLFMAIYMIHVGDAIKKNKPTQNSGKIQPQQSETTQD